MIFLTIEESSDRGKALGAAAFLKKPIVLQKLLDTVADCLGVGDK